MPEILRPAGSLTAALGVAPAMEGDLFARGYVLAEGEDPAAPVGWRSESFEGFHLRVDPRLPVSRVRVGGGDLLCLGTLFDAGSPTLGGEEVAASLAGALLASEQQLLDELGLTCGRHALVYRRPDGESFLVTDATGMKPAFYSVEGRRVIASHTNLVALNRAGTRRSPRIRFRYGYPGNWTPYDGVYLLTPNTKLPLSGGPPERFWPLEPVARMAVEEAAHRARELFRNAFKYIAANYRPLVSMTAGIDSRVTLALTREHPRSRFFTYYRGEGIGTDSLDRNFAIEIRERLGLSHDMVEGDSLHRLSPQLAALLRANTYYSHFPSLAQAYLDRYGGADYVHVRSNLGEIGRRFWGRQRIDGCSDLARIWIGARDCSPEELAVADEAFASFAATTGLLACRDKVDVVSLFYWEFRMAAWHSQVLVESDPAFDTLSIFNCREALAALLSVSEEEQRQSAVFKAIIRNEWPELAAYPVNGKPF